VVEEPLHFRIQTRTTSSLTQQIQECNAQSFDMDSFFDPSELEPTDSFFTLARGLTSAKGLPPASNKKKKRHDCGPRDSLASRLKVGSPGSRRYKNWELEQSLRFNLEESESSLSSDELDFEEKCEPSYGAFGLYFYDPTLQSLLKPFLDITEEEERIMQGFDVSCSYEPDSQCSSPADSFNLLKLQSQRLLRKHSDRHFVTEMDRRIFEFCVGSTSLTRFEFDSSFTRCLAHAVSEFYGLICFSRKAKNGKITFVEKRSDFLAPSITLSDFLATLPPLDPY